MRDQVILAALLAAPLAAPGQQTPDTPVFRITSTLIEVDAVVTDSRGRHVTGLGLKDFEVYQDGKPQRLTHVSYVRLAPEVPADLRPRRPAGSPGPAPQVRREDVRRTFVLMVDDLGLSFEGMAFVRRSLRKFVEQDMQPGDLVAVCRTGQGSGALQQFTVDKRILLSVVDGLRWNPNGRYGVSIFQPLRNVAVPAGSLAPYPSYDIPQRNLAFTLGTLGAVNYIVEALREMPGRKSIVLFSDGIVQSQGQDVLEALRRLIERANRAGTVIYTMHAAGLVPLVLTAEDQPALGQKKLSDVWRILREAADNRRTEFHRAQQGLAYLAYETGGLPYENGNDLNWGLRQVLADQQGYYLLAYIPAESTFTARDRARHFYRIRVKVIRKGLRVRSRSGFFGETDEETLPKYTSPAESLRAAMLSPFRSAGIRLRLTALYAEVPKQGSVVRNLMHIDGRDLKFELAADGTVHARLSLLAVAADRESRPLENMLRVYELKVAAGRLNEVIRDGALYTLDIPVPKPGAYHIRAAVRDESTGRLGSASQFLEIPDLNRTRLALASVVLEDADSGSPGLTTARRQFRRGGQLRYVCLIQNGRKQAAGPDLAARIRIVRDGAEIYSAPAEVAELEEGRRAVVGVLRLLDAITPGEYFMQVTAAERGRSKAGAERWADFEVLP